MTEIFTFLKKYWLYIVFSLLVILIFTLNQFLNQSTPQSIPIPTPTYKITYKNIQPGITSKSQLSQILGEPTNQTQQTNLTISEFTSSYPSDPHLAVNKNGVNQLFIQQTPLKPIQNISQYIQQFGFSDNVKFLKHLGPEYNLTIYLNQGLAFGSHINTGEIVEIWYFQPQTIQELKLISPYPLLPAPLQYDSR